MKKSTFLILSVVALMFAMVSACKKTPAPTAEIAATINGYAVTFISTVTDVDTYSWNFGDGQTSTEASPAHTYAVSGSYNVVLTVKGGGGSAIAAKTITIEASVLEMLTGGPSAANGKTWVLSSAAYAGDGIGPVTTDMSITTPTFDNFLGLYGLHSVYSNEFTFYANGNYKMYSVNDTVLGGLVYADNFGLIGDSIGYDIAMCKTAFTPPHASTWTLNTTDLTVDAITDPFTTSIPPPHQNVTFSGKTWISLSDTAYFGILDFRTTAKFIVKEITPSKMSVALFLCGYFYADNVADKMLPTNLVQFTFVPKTHK